MRHTAADKTIQSPCTRVCTLNDQNVCIGCLRTLDEIKTWADADDTTRRAILKRVAERRR